MDRMRQILLGASDSDLETLRAVLTNDDLGRVVDSMGLCNSVWNVEPFADKVGFAQKENAFRAARHNGLIDSDMLLADAVGRTLDARSNVILNPVPEDTVVSAGSRARVRFMTPANLMEWLSGCRTRSAEKLRRGLVWFYATHERDKALSDLDAVSQELVAARQEIGAKDEAIAELTALLEDHKREEQRLRPNPSTEVFKLYRQGDLVVSMRRRPSTVAARAKVLGILNFEEVPGLAPFQDACDTWDGWQKLATSMGLCHRQPVPYTNKKGRTVFVNAYLFTPLTPATLDSMLATLTPARAEWLRGTLAVLGGVVDTMQSTLDGYLVPMTMED